MTVKVCIILLILEDIQMKNNITTEFKATLHELRLVESEQIDMFTKLKDYAIRFRPSRWKSVDASWETEGGNRYAEMKYEDIDCPDIKLTIGASMKTVADNLVDIEVYSSSNCTQVTSTYKRHIMSFLRKLQSEL